jgi:hypothetical protein
MHLPGDGKISRRGTRRKEGMKPQIFAGKREIKIKTDKKRIYPVPSSRKAYIFLLIICVYLVSVCGVFSLSLSILRRLNFFI